MGLTGLSMARRSARCHLGVQGHDRNDYAELTMAARAHGAYLDGVTVRVLIGFAGQRALSREIERDGHVRQKHSPPVGNNRNNWLDRRDGVG